MLSERSQKRMKIVNLGGSNKHSKFKIIIQKTDLKYMSPFPVEVSLHTMYA
jgi:hypothetical protein